MPEGGEEGKWFYQSGNIFAKITYGLKRLGNWEFNFESRHYVFLPLFNILVAAIIVFAVMPDDIIYHIKNKINNIKKWKRKE